MKILDLDLDYFMTEVAHNIAETSTGRIEDEDYVNSVWLCDDVIKFFEDNLGLSKKKRIPGRIVSGHNESLFFWKELIMKGELSVPFEVVHIDSHADLGLGTDTPTFISRELLKWPVKERPNHSWHTNCFGRECAEGIADYLLFAIAYRWINKLTYCGNPNVSSNDYDVHTLKNFEEEPLWEEPVENTIQLLFNPSMDCPHRYMDDQSNIDAYIDASVKEPEVPFKIIPTIEDVCYQGDFDYVVLAQSPNYTPLNADFILDIFREYIIEI